MYKPFLLLIATLLLPLSASAYNREGQDYVRMAIGYGSSKPDKGMQTTAYGDITSAAKLKGSVFNGEIGRYLTDEWRIGLDALYTSGFKGKEKFAVTGLSGSFYERYEQMALFLATSYEFGNGRVRPFVTLGAGALRNNMKSRIFTTDGDVQVSMNNIQFATMVGAGLAYEYTVGLDVELLGKAMGTNFINKTRNCKCGSSGKTVTETLSPTIDGNAFVKANNTYALLLGLRASF
jgi:hypothetical protein